MSYQPVKILLPGEDVDTYMGMYNTLLAQPCELAYMLALTHCLSASIYAN